jgi:pyruvate/2-oxoglutarate dehydrogenase complex dihydrolipoamide acyltransferase (E2) component
VIVWDLEAGREAYRVRLDEVAVGGWSNDLDLALQEDGTVAAALGDHGPYNVVVAGPERPAAIVPATVMTAPIHGGIQLAGGLITGHRWTGTAQHDHAVLDLDGNVVSVFVRNGFSAVNVDWDGRRLGWYDTGGRALRIEDWPYEAPLPALAAPAPAAAPAPPAPAAAGTVATRCRVPALRGRTRAAAVRRLRSAGCRLGRVRMASGRGTRPGAAGRGRPRVVAQSPRAGRVVAAGTRVRLTIGARRR